MTVTLPEERVLRIRANSVTFTSIGATQASTADPTMMDIGGAQLTLDEAREEMTASLRELDADTGESDRWYREAARTRGTSRVESPWVATKVGYLTVDVQGRYNPLTESALVAYVLTW